MNASLRQMGRVGLLAATVAAGGCAVYATPGDPAVGVSVVPPPVIIDPSPPVVVRPYPYYGYYGYRPGPRIYPRAPAPPRYVAPRNAPPPRYHAPPRYRPPR